MLITIAKLQSNAHRSNDIEYVTVTIFQVESASFNEKSLWNMLPESERIVLCEKIGFTDSQKSDQNRVIGKNIQAHFNRFKFGDFLAEHKYQFCLGNLSLSLVVADREILILTVTQFILSIIPSFKADSYKAVLKVEGIVVEGASKEAHLIPVLSSEHSQKCPAYFLKIEFEKMPLNSKAAYKLNGALSTVEVFYQEVSYKVWILV